VQQGLQQQTRYSTEWNNKQGTARSGTTNKVQHGVITITECIVEMEWGASSEEQAVDQDLSHTHTTGTEPKHAEVQESNAHEFKEFASKGQC
jgi:hypothetical protein